MADFVIQRRMSPEERVFEYRLTVRIAAVSGRMPRRNMGLSHLLELRGWEPNGLAAMRLHALSFQSPAQRIVLELGE